MADAYYLRPPRKQMFYRILATFTTYCGIGDQTWWGFDPPSGITRKLFFANNILVKTLSPLLLISQIVYLIINYQDLNFDTRGTMFAIAPVTAMINVIVISSKQKSFMKVMKNFIGEIHLCNLEVQDNYVAKKRIKMEKLTRFISYFMTFFLTLDWLAWCMVTGINSYHNREYIQNKTRRLETVIYVVVPFDYEHNIRYWTIIHTCNIYVVWCGCAIINIHNATNYACIFQLIGHIEILKHRIQTNFNQRLSQEEVSKRLIDVVKYHTFVINILKEIQDGFGLNVSAYYLYNLVADSLNLYQLMAGEKRNAMVYALMVIVYVGGLVMMSFVLEEVRRQSDGLADSVYYIDWQSMSVTNRKMVILILMRIQPALVFTAAGGFKAGVRPMISIARTSFSIYVMLKQSMKA
ncbi:hypothetical protein O0L34_g11580 [Tuta absoluta]|nr:hypothetical protein O0L34_g11580 [Tuta absoluta]